MIKAYKTHVPLNSENQIELEEPRYKELLKVASKIGVQKINIFNILFVK